MSTKEWVLEPAEGVGIYQECIYDSSSYEVNPNPAVIQLDHTAATTISQKLINDELTSQFTLEASIPATTLDRIAIHWRKKRCLNTNKYSVDQLVSKRNSSQYYLANESTEALEERSEQPEIDAELEMDNIFNTLTSDPLEAGYLQECSNKLLQLRELGRNLSQKYPMLSKISSKNEYAKSLMMMEMLLDDYDSNLLLIDALSCSIARFEANNDVLE